MVLILLYFVLLGSNCIYFVIFNSIFIDILRWTRGSRVPRPSFRFPYSKLLPVHLEDCDAQRKYSHRERSKVVARSSFFTCFPVCSSQPLNYRCEFSYFAKFWLLIGRRPEVRLDVCLLVASDVIQVVCFWKSHSVGIFFTMRP